MKKIINNYIAKKSLRYFFKRAKARYSKLFTNRKRLKQIS